LKKAKRLFLYLLNLPLYWITRLVPKDENIWIFGAWFGEKYADNSKYLFEYVNQNHPEIRAIWFTTNKETEELIRVKGYEAYKTYSFKGYFYSSRSNYSFISVGAGDVNFFVPAKYIINLWHGCPLKKIGFDDKITANYKHSLLKLFFKSIFGFSKQAMNHSKIFASSETEAKKLSTAFNKRIKNIIVTGLPRNDVFINAQKGYKENLFRAIYMPTHRNEGELNIGKLFLDDIEMINEKLRFSNIELHIKLHFYHMKQMNIKNYSNIKALDDNNIQQDIYSVMPQYDILITDYSSIFFDYLLTDKPIVFAPFDFEEYLKKDRELYYDYDEVTPGPKCKSWDEVLDWIVKFKENPELYKKERETVKNRFHNYQDGKSCERVYEEIIKLRKKDNK